MKKNKIFSEYEPIPHLHWVRIRVTREFRCGEIIEEKLWMGLRTEIKMKYDWYFRYRAALLQILYPKFYVQLEHAIYPATGDQLKIILQNKLKATERKISQYEKHIEKVTKEWLSLLPHTEDTGYKMMIEKIEKLKQRKSNLEREINV